MLKFVTCYHCLEHIKFCMGTNYSNLLIFIKNILLLFILFSACNNIENDTRKVTSLNSIAEGKKLAASYCKSCHMLPDPSLLNKATWEDGVLPHMGPLLGIFE